MRSQNGCSNDRDFLVGRDSCDPSSVMVGCNSTLLGDSMRHRESSSRPSTCYRSSTSSCSTLRSKPTSSLFSVSSAVKPSHLLEKNRLNFINFQRKLVAYTDFDQWSLVKESELFGGVLFPYALFLRYILVKGFPQVSAEFIRTIPGFVVEQDDKKLIYTIYHKLFYGSSGGRDAGGCLKHKDGNGPFRVSNSTISSTVSDVNSNKNGTIYRPSPIGAYKPPITLHQFLQPSKELVCHKVRICTDFLVMMKRLQQGIHREEANAVVQSERRRMYAHMQQEDRNRRYMIHTRQINNYPSITAEKQSQNMVNQNAATGKNHEIIAREILQQSSPPLGSINTLSRGIDNSEKLQGEITYGRDWYAELLMEEDDVCFAPGPKTKSKKNNVDDISRIEADSNGRAFSDDYKEGPHCDSEGSPYTIRTVKRVLDCTRIPLGGKLQLRNHTSPTLSSKDMVHDISPYGLLLGSPPYTADNSATKENMNIDFYKPIKSVSEKGDASDSLGLCVQKCQHHTNHLLHSTGKCGEPGGHLCGRHCSHILRRADGEQLKLELKEAKVNYVRSALNRVHRAPLNNETKNVHCV